MKNIGLSETELEGMRGVFRAFPEIREVVLFGSRAKGTHRPQSDVDLALMGGIDGLQAEAIAEELEELPMPYQFDVKALDAIRYPPLREHIARVGVTIYRREGSGE
ncbi:MAG: nucleotidyltransferase domain-containing protein [Magnetococcales bacterium]|nr:nucleotidyltransferase domain-containing protein [Magnetococcales bacterium]